MGQGISEVLTFAVGAAISPVPIIAVIFDAVLAAGESERADVPRRLGGDDGAVPRLGPRLDREGPCPTDGVNIRNPQSRLASA
jgi:hypothetical protein